LKQAFTLSELLVTMAMLALLLGLGAPQFISAVERARVARVQSDLRLVDVALEAYWTDHRHYPPVTVSCMSADQGEVMQLPVELAEGGYLSRSEKSKTSSILQDPFHPGHTYKYAAPERFWMNGDLLDERYAVWIPSDFPLCRSDAGRADNSESAPLAWAVWSLGPRADRKKALSNKAPLAGHTWYLKTGDAGVIARYKERNGPSRSTR
jgi:prepilin-type N-terminal cleavage/methylation domain-containing protein